MSQTPPPLRVERIEYHPPPSGRRGILTAVGVVSIVISGLGILMGCAGLVNVMVFGWVGMGTPGSRTIAPTLPDPAMVISTPAQMPASDRKIVVAAMNARQPLSRPRQRMLDKLLAQDGANMFFGPITSSAMPTNISESGQLSGVGGIAGNDYFVIGMGRIEVGDDQAVFSPTNGDDVRVYADDSTVHLRAAQASGAFPTTTYSYSATSVVGAGMGVFYATTGACNFILAIFLLICGILVLRNSRRGRRLHLAYAGIKIPVEIIATCGYVWMMSGLVSGMPSATTPGLGFMKTFMVISSIVPGAIACAYPIALLIVINWQSVKQ